MSVSPIVMQAFLLLIFGISTIFSSPLHYSERQNGSGNIHVDVNDFLILGIIPEEAVKLAANIEFRSGLEKFKEELKFSEKYKEGLKVPEKYKDGLAFPFPETVVFEGAPENQQKDETKSDNIKPSPNQTMESQLFQEGETDIKNPSKRDDDDDLTLIGGGGIDGLGQECGPDGHRDSGGVCIYEPNNQG